MATDKPEGYPYTTVRTRGDRFCAVIVDWDTQHGFEQESMICEESEFIAAKHEAVNMANFLGINYKVPVHG